LLECTFPGNRKITVNKRDIDEFFDQETLKVIVRQPLTATNNADKFDVMLWFMAADPQARRALSATALQERSAK
jgi:ribosomal protein S9